MTSGGGPVERRALLGFWSTDEVYSGNMEHELVFFGSDGHGWFAWENAGATRGSMFTWRTDHGRLTTRTILDFSDETSGRLRLRPGDGHRFDMDAVPVTRGVEDGPYGTRPLVLRVPRSSTSQAFTERFGYVGARCPDRWWTEIGRLRRGRMEL